jgi:hypothetical protein
MFMLWLGILSILVGAALQCLRHPVVRQKIKKVFNWEPEWWFDTISFYLIPVVAIIGLIALTLTYHGRKLAEEALHDTRTKVMTLEERELWRSWAMIVPTGEVASDVGGFKLAPGGPMANRYRKIFIREGNTIRLDMNQCQNKEYRDEIKSLIRDFPRIPYTYVALSWCLKIINDPAWKEEAEQAKEVLEKLLDIKPHVVTIDSYYLWLVRDILEIPINGNRYWNRGEKGEYIPKDMPWDIP